MAHPCEGRQEYEYGPAVQRVFGACIWVFDGVAGLLIKTLLSVFA